MPKSQYMFNFGILKDTFSTLQRFACVFQGKRQAYDQAHVRNDVSRSQARWQRVALGALGAGVPPYAASQCTVRGYRGFSPQH